MLFKRTFYFCLLIYVFVLLFGYDFVLFMLFGAFLFFLVRVKTFWKKKNSNNKSFKTVLITSFILLLLHIHFYLIWTKNDVWIVIALKSATFSAPESTPKTALETIYLCYFSKAWLKTRKKKLGIIFDGIHQFYQYFLSASSIFCYLGKLPSHTWLENNYA